MEFTFFRTFINNLTKKPANLILGSNLDLKINLAEMSRSQICKAAMVGLQPTKNEIPESEFEAFKKKYLAHSSILKPKYITRLHQKHNVISAYTVNNFDLVAPIIDALKLNKPFSLVRISDGLAPLIDYLSDEAHPNLDEHAAKMSLFVYNNSFNVDRNWLLLIREILTVGVLSADMIGFRPLSKVMSDKQILPHFNKDLRGHVGIWKSHLIENKFLNHGLLDRRYRVTVHCYFDIVERLDDIAEACKKITCLTTNSAIVGILEKRFPKHQILKISLQRTPFFPNERGNFPDFLFKTREQLPDDMTGQLVLIGAGAWTSIYAYWVKERGGVALDIGSGFSLLRGQASRPVHRERFPDLPESNDFHQSV